MSTNTTREKKKTPFYQDVDGFRIPGLFSADAFRSAITYKPRSDDLFIVTHPKCGTTWVQNIVACIYRGGNPFSSGIEFLSQTPFLEMTGAEGGINMERPGAIKVHLPFHLTPYSPNAKYIFVARNPKDACVSFYHHTESMPLYEYEGGEFDDYFELYVAGETDFGDYFDTLLSWYEHRNDRNVLFFTYEQLKEDTKTYVLKIADFMGPQYKDALEKDGQMLKDVIHHSSFGYMKEHFNKHFSELAAIPKEAIRNNPDIPPGLRKLLTAELNIFKGDSSSVIFIRKGIVGDWRNYFSAEQNARMMKKYELRTAGTDISDLWKDYM